MRKFNLPTDYIHCPTHSYGWLILPIGKRWFMYAKLYGFCLTDKKCFFHNCTTTGIK